MATNAPGLGLGDPSEVKDFQWRCPLQNENGLALWRWNSRQESKGHSTVQSAYLQNTLICKFVSLEAITFVGPWWYGIHRFQTNIKILFSNWTAYLVSQSDDCGRTPPQPTPPPKKKKKRRRGKNKKTNHFFFNIKTQNCGNSWLKFK